MIGVLLALLGALHAAAWGGDGSGPSDAAPGTAPTSAAAPQAPPGARPIRHVRTRDPEVAITFDACATRSQAYGFDRAVFQVLKREQIPATIFVSGRWVESHPDTMRELARESFIEFGDHSYDHPHMPRLAPEDMATEIDRTEAALARFGKRSVAFRPPFGDWSPRVVEVAEEKQLPTVTWDVVSGDPSLKTTADQMIRTVVHKARPGSIIIFHINGRGWKTAEALPTILRELRARGFRFVRLSELMRAGPRILAAASTASPEPALPPGLAAPAAPEASPTSASPIVWTPDPGRDGATVPAPVTLEPAATAAAVPPAAGRADPRPVPVLP